jgi:hypothetical protein
VIGLHIIKKVASLLGTHQPVSRLTSNMNDRRFEKPITRIGFFHFGTRADGHPVETLKRELESEEAKGTDLAECLLVLPEAFNIVGDYRPTPADPTISRSLIKLSKDKRVAFVVGLKTRKLGCCGPFNCAYLIDGCTRKRLACKSSQDSAGGYAPRPYFRAVLHRGHTIAALICLDATRTTDIRENVILCVPAHFTMETPKQVVEVWAGKSKALVVANSSDQHPSVICVHGHSEMSGETDRSSTNPHHYTSIRFAELD